MTIVISTKLFGQNYSSFFSNTDMDVHRCLTQRTKRNPLRQGGLLLQALEEELPAGTIRYSYKIVSMEGGNVKILQLADGSVLRAKVKKKNYTVDGYSMVQFRVYLKIWVF